MRVTDFRSFGLEIEREAQLLSEIRTLLESAGPSDGPRHIRQVWKRSFEQLGWAGDVPVRGSNLTVGYIREDVAVCIQLGNVARTYADMLKLQALFASDRIEVGVIVVPSDKWARELGSNHACFTRLEREIALFADVINLPLLVVGVGE
ncbi:MAG: BglII/BstYI family type II restriction endonuclease [Coriobacteriia bacterium]|nr:BglII/BstYI family type II restriction endonuclease [Coriobacteriia bacterium]